MALASHSIPGLWPAPSPRGDCFCEANSKNSEPSEPSNLFRTFEEPENLEHPENLVQPVSEEARKWETSITSEPFFNL